MPVLLASLAWTMAVLLPAPPPSVVQTQDTRAVCAAGFAHRQRLPRLQWARLKDKVYTAHGMRRGARRGYVIDHRVPLELGGSNSPSNLWPEPREESYRKDRVENALHELVCSGRLSLREAQLRIVRNWKTAVPREVQRFANP